MRVPAFTPGPWFAERREHCSIVRQSAVRDSYSSRVAECHQWSPAPHPQPTPDEAFANAHLIAAAPDLYEALEALVREATGYWEVSDHHPPLVNAQAALARARGEQQ